MSLISQKYIKTMSEIKKKTYKYDYPEQRELAKGLQHGDITRIAMLAKKSRQMVAMMVYGERKMTKKVSDLIVKFTEINKQKEVA